MSTLSTLSTLSAPAASGLPYTKYSDLLGAP